VRSSEVDKYRCNIENLLDLKRNIIIKVSSGLDLDEDVVEVLFNYYLLFVYLNHSLINI
jgi:hypothetical protein